MKKLTLLSLFLLVGTLAMAQGRISIGGNLALPMGDFADVVGTGFGVTGRYEAPINDNLTWNGTIGFLSFGKKTIDEVDYSATIIPITGGLKYYFQGETFNGFYAGADLGFFAAKFKQDAPAGFDEFDKDVSETEFGIGLGAGYHLTNIDIQATYNIVNDADFFGIRVAYVLGGN